MRYWEIINETTGLNWAVGKDVSKAQARYLQKDPQNAVVWANIEDLFKHTDRNFKLDLQDPKGGENSIGDRVANAKSHWQSGEFMDPSEVAVVNGNEVSFGNGRHRLVAAYQMGHEFAPVVIDRDYLEDFKKLVRTK